jgi:hypothetical protein
MSRLFLSINLIVPRVRGGQARASGLGPVPEAVLKAARKVFVQHDSRQTGAIQLPEVEALLRCAQPSAFLAGHPPPIGVAVRQ